MLKPANDNFRVCEQHSVGSRTTSAGFRSIRFGDPQLLDPRLCVAVDVGFAGWPGVVDTASHTPQPKMPRLDYRPALSTEVRLWRGLDTVRQCRCHLRPDTVLVRQHGPNAVWQRPRGQPDGTCIICPPYKSEHPWACTYRHFCLPICVVRPEKFGQTPKCSSGANGRSWSKSAPVLF